MSNVSDKISVWVIDDEENVCTLISAALNETKDMTCNESFGRCDTALSRLKEKHRMPRVILLDIGLPGINGLDGIKMLKHVSPSTKIVMMTVDDKDRSVFQALTAGADGYILKGSSFTGEYVARAIREVEGGGISLDPTIGRKVVEMLRAGSKPAVNYNLTERENQVLHLIVEGLKFDQIAQELKIAYETVASHYKNICSKLNVHDKGQLVRRAILDHLI